MSIFDKALNVVTLGMYDDIKGELTGANASRDAAQLQDEYNMKYWNMQNEYNKPINQMKRFEEAGLNPNLIYTQQNTAGDIGAVKVQPADSLLNTASKFSSVAAIAQGLRQGAANISNTQANTENLKKTNSLLTTQKQMAEAELERYTYETELMKRRGITSGANWLERGIGYAMDMLDVPKVMNYVGDKVGTFVGDTITSNPFKEQEYRVIKYRPLPTDNRHMFSKNSYHSIRKQFREESKLKNWKW